MNKLKFDFDYVQKYYGRDTDGVEYILYPASAPKRLFVTFTSMNDTGDYQRVEQFWREGEDWKDTAYLFFRDVTSQWYRNIDAIIKIIQAWAGALGVSRVFICGSSMGAHAAMLCGLRMPAYAVLATCAHIRGDCTDNRLQEALEKCEKLPLCYIEARGPAPDQEFIKYVTEAYCRRGGLCICHSIPDPVLHAAINLWDMKFTNGLIDAFEQWRLCNGEPCL